MIVRSLRDAAALAALALTGASCAGLLGLDQGVEDGFEGGTAGGVVPRPDAMFADGLSAWSDASLDTNPAPDAEELDSWVVRAADAASPPSDVWIATAPDTADEVSPVPDATPPADVATSDGPPRDGLALEGMAPDGMPADAINCDAVMESDAAAIPDALVCTGGAVDCDHNPANGCECDAVPNGMVVCTANGSCGHICGQGYIDCAGHSCSCGGGNRCLSDNTCGTCRASLASCRAGSDCCSGNCTLTVTCL